LVIDSTEVLAFERAFLLNGGKQLNLVCGLSLQERLLGWE